MSGHERSGRLGRLGRLRRLATPAALVYGSVFPLVQLGILLEYPDGSVDVAWPLAVTATACYLPLHLHHVYWAARGARPPAGGWTLAALAAVVTLALPFGGSHWLAVYAVVAASAMLVLRWPWSLLAAGGVVVAQAPLALVVDSPIPHAPIYYVITVWWRASTLFVPIWLLGAIRRLEETRWALAAEAVVRERLRIDGELRRTVGVALSSITARGQRAAALDGTEAGALASEVRELVGGSRRALAEARRVVNGFHRPSLAGELEAAAALLAAAGIRSRVEVRGDPLAPDAEGVVGPRLRAAAAGVLRDSTVRACVITVASGDGRVDVTVRTEDGTGAGRVETSA